MKREKFIYSDPNSIYSWEFYFDPNFPGYVDIKEYAIGAGPGCKAWLHRIENNKIVLRYDNYFNFTEGAINYINKIIMLKVFL